MTLSQLESAKDEAEKLLRIVAPDMVGQSVYLLTRECAPKLFDAISIGWIGMTVDAGAAGVRPILERTGQWCGDGFVCLLNVLAIDSAAELAAVCCHELAHHLEWELSKTIDPAAAFLSTMRAVLAPPGKDDALPWSGHDMQFVRCCCHLRRRCFLAGRGDVASLLHFAGKSYSVSNSCWYSSACRQECERYKDWPLRDVLAENPPSELVELWTEDTEKQLKCDAGVSG